MRKSTKFIELKQVFKTLHGPNGCMWDKKQTHESLIPCMREEVREFAAAIKGGDHSHMEEELGDILLNVMAHAQIAKKSGEFDIEDVIATLIRKLKRRHPHVFGKTKVKSAREIIINWNKIKAREKAGKRRAKMSR
jgi:MazG family protein